MERKLVTDSLSLHKDFSISTPVSLIKSHPLPGKSLTAIQELRCMARDKLQQNDCHFAIIISKNMHVFVILGVIEIKAGSLLVMRIN